MTAITCTRRIQFCAGHRVYQHESKCAHIHGHNYVVFFHARQTKSKMSRELRSAVVAEGHAKHADAIGKELDDIGRVIDFGVLKAKLGTWIDTHWDHGMLLYERDPMSQLWYVQTSWGSVNPSPSICGMKHFILPYNPTAENMARYLGETVAPVELEGTGVEIVKVVLWETENCYATWEK